MDFLDSLDSYSTNSAKVQTHRKRRRMRSWYLLEQYKALEKHQTAVALALRYRAYPERVLQQELQERRLRRRLVDDFSIQSDSGIDRVSTARTCYSLDFDDSDSLYELIKKQFEESHNELDDVVSVGATRESPEDDEFLEIDGGSLGLTLDTTQSASAHRSVGECTSPHSTDECASQRSDNVCTSQRSDECDPQHSEGECADDASVSQQSNNAFSSHCSHDTCASQHSEDTCGNSDNENDTHNNTLATEDIMFDDNPDSNYNDDISKRLEFSKYLIAEDIALQLETVQENIEDLDQLRMSQEEPPTKDGRFGGADQIVCPKVKQDDDGNNILLMWSKLVSFAYQVVQLNHGNCYYDYSSQLLTGVLAFDILCRGLNKMCHILQPYVSPIKFVSDGDGVCSQNSRRKHDRTRNTALFHSEASRKSKKIFGKQEAVKASKSCRSTHNYVSCSPLVYKCENSPLESLRCYSKRIRRNSEASQPARDVRENGIKLSPKGKDKFVSNIWPEELSRNEDNDAFNCYKPVKNPMLKIGRYIDRFSEHCF